MPLNLWCDDVILCPYFENQTDEKKEKKINEEPKINIKRCKKKGETPNVCGSKKIRRSSLHSNSPKYKCTTEFVI